MPHLASSSKPALQLAMWSEAAGFKVQKIDARLGLAAKGHIDHRRPVNGRHVVRYRLVRPRTARNHDDLVHVLSQRASSRPVMFTRGIEATTEEGQTHDDQGKERDER